MICCILCNSVIRVLNDWRSPAYVTSKNSVVFIGRPSYDILINNVYNKAKTNKKKLTICMGESCTISSLTCIWKTDRMNFYFMPKWMTAKPDDHVIQYDLRTLCLNGCTSQSWLHDTGKSLLLICFITKYWLDSYPWSSFEHL